MTIKQLQLSSDLWLVETEGRLDQSQTPQFEKILKQLLARQTPQFIVDLSQATYINSGGLRCLLTGRRLSRKQGGDIVLCGLERLSEVFKMVGLDQVLIIYETRDEARALLIEETGRPVSQLGSGYLPKQAFGALCIDLFQQTEGLWPSLSLLILVLAVFGTTLIIWRRYFSRQILMRRIAELETLSAAGRAIVASELDVYALAELIANESEKDY